MRGFLFRLVFLLFRLVLWFLMIFITNFDHFFKYMTWKVHFERLNITITFAAMLFKFLLLKAFWTSPHSDGFSFGFLLQSCIFVSIETHQVVVLPAIAAYNCVPTIILIILLLRCKLLSILKLVKFLWFVFNQLNRSRKNLFILILWLYLSRRARWKLLSFLRQIFIFINGNWRRLLTRWNLNYLFSLMRNIEHQICEFFQAFINELLRVIHCVIYEII